MTVFIREISPQGELRDVFLSDTRDAERQTAYSAQRALLVRGDSGPTLVMFEGMIQTLENDARTLSVTRFEDLAYDLSGLLGPTTDRRRIAELSTAELLAADPAVAEEVRQTRGRLVAEGHERISQSLISIVVPLLGFSVLLLAGFTRFGIWRQILGAVIAVIIVKAADTSLVEFAMTDPRLWPFVHGGWIFGIGMVIAALSLARQPFTLSRLRRARA